ncbi:MAG: HD domain-containing protein [Desulfobacter sp.]|nr:HD domain-containing protein [Desulfobacter sp.]
MDKRPVFVFYIGPRGKDLLSGDKQFSVSSGQGPADFAGLIQPPDLILLDPFSTESGPGLDPEIGLEWKKGLDPDQCRSFPPLFAIVPEDSGKQVRLDLMASGFDQILDWPISGQEIKLKIRVYREKYQMEKQLVSKKDALAKSFEYLDRFKAELKRTKTELMEERTSLNTALKQIQQMTLERGRLKSGAAQLKTALKQNVDGFGRLLQTLVTRRVEKNRGHGQRVAAVARFIAKEMGFDEKKLEDLGKAAMLHEVGLLFMSDPPDTDIRDDGKTKEQIPRQSAAYDKTLMMQFPVKGAQLLSQCPGFESPARIIGSLNENSDGTGYPDGLKRRDISMASRILAGADELEQLKDRKDIQGQEALLAALEDLSGVRLDPVIVGWLEKYVVAHMGTDAFQVRGVGIEQLEPEMVLGTALFTTTGTKLFKSNTLLTQDSIDKIIQYHREYPVDDTVYIKV